MHPVARAPLSPPLLLIGGSVRAAAEDAARAGYGVIAIDRFGDRDLRAVCQDWCRWGRQEDWRRLIDRWPTVPIVPTGGFTWNESGDVNRTESLSEKGSDPLRRGQKRNENDSPPKGQTPFRIGSEIDTRFERETDRLIAFPTPRVFAALSDPEQLRAVAERCGIDFPKTFSAADWLADQARLGNQAAVEPRDWLIKPRFGTGGLGIRRWQPEATMQTASPGPQEDLQQWIAGRSLGVSYFARQRRGQRITRLLGACEGLTHRSHRTWRWLYGGSIGPLPLSADCRERLRRIGEQVATSFELVGLFNVDLIRRRDGSLVLLEINPRYSASMELLSFLHNADPSRNASATGPVSLIDWHLAAYQENSARIDTAAADERTLWNNELDGAISQSSDIAAGRLGCKRIVYARAAMQIDQSTTEWLQRIPLIPGLQVSFHDLPADGETISAGHPALTVILRGRSASATLAQYSHRIAAQLRRRLRSA